MPTERRKFQNRINQRRYRMQIKNRIQMLEKAIIDSGAATVLDLDLSKTTTENDGNSSGRQSLSTPASDIGTAPDLDPQNSAPWSFDPSPDSLDESCFFASQDFFEGWNKYDLTLDQETSPLPDPNQRLQLSESGSSGSPHRLNHLSRWEPSVSVRQSDILGSRTRPDSIERDVHSESFRNEPLISVQTSGQSRKMTTMENVNEAKSPRTRRRKARDPKEKIIASLREENKRLKELSTALVTMYDCTAKPTNAGKEIPKCHNLHAAVKKFIASAFSNDTSSCVQIPSRHGKHDNSDLGVFMHPVIKPPCSQAESDIAQLAMQDLKFSELSADLTGRFDQGAAGVQSLVSYVGWDSHPEQMPTMSDSNHAHLPPAGRTRDPLVSVTTVPTSGPKIHQYSDRTNLLTSLPLPSSHAYLEPTFSRRLVRLLWEYAFTVLTGPHIPETQLNRCFGFCLRSRTKETLIKKFKAYLGLSNDPVTALDRQVWNTAPDVRDERDEAGDEWDYWIEAGKVETYLESLGFSLAGNEGKNILKFAPVLSQTQQLSESPGLSYRGSGPSSITNEIQGQLQIPPSTSAPQIPYGSKWQPSSCPVNTLFDHNGDFHATSWRTPSPSEATKPFSIPGAPACLNAEGLLQRDSGCYLDVNRFFAGLIDVSICLGRAAGFKRVDVDNVLKKSLVKF